MAKKEQSKRRRLKKFTWDEGDIQIITIVKRGIRSSDIERPKKKGKDDGG
jgi:hypothetical protein